MTPGPANTSRTPRDGKVARHEADTCTGSTAASSETDTRARRQGGEVGR
jgi:hypothetical protein